jgi:alkylation response protein AidB-like acyl-CoA dehydrogenase
MHNVVRLPEQRALGPDQIATEMEALAAARNVAARMVQLGAEGTDAPRPNRPMEWVAQAGLLGISIPDEFGGPDVANAAIAEVIAILAEANLAVGDYVKAHYRVLEALRLGGSHEQKNIFFAHARAGEHFYLPFPQDLWCDSFADGITLVSDRTGYQLAGAVVPTAASSSHWVVIPARDPMARTVMVFLDRASRNLVVAPFDADAEGRLYGSPTVQLEQLHVPADAVIPVNVAPDAHHSTLHSLNRILDAAAKLGLARSVFAELCRHLRASGSASGSVDAINVAFPLELRVGRLSAHLEGASAAVERAGQHLDMAQVDTSAQTAQHACLSTCAAIVLSGDVALEVLAAFIEVVNPPATHAAHQNRQFLMNGAMARRSLAHLVRQAFATDR